MGKKRLQEYLMFIIALLARALLKIRTKTQAYVYGWVLSLGLMKLHYWSNLEKHILLRIEKRMWLIFFFFLTKHFPGRENVCGAVSGGMCAGCEARASPG